MSMLPAGAIDCDIHPSVPSVAALMPYLEDHWREQVVIRGIDELNSISYPLNSPLTCRINSSFSITHGPMMNSNGCPGPHR